MGSRLVVGLMKIHAIKNVQDLGNDHDLELSSDGVLLDRL